MSEKGHSTVKSMTSALRLFRVEVPFVATVRIGIVCTIDCAADILTAWGPAEEHDDVDMCDGVDSYSAFLVLPG